MSLQRADHNLGRRTVEYAVNGTAIRSTPSEERAEPVLTDLSVQDYSKLIRAGQEPVGLVATTVAVFASPSRDTRIKRARTFRANQELTEISQAFRLARDSIRRDLRDQITQVGGAGVVGVELSQSTRREKLALGVGGALSRAPWLGTGPARSPVLRVGPDRGRAAWLGDHDARRRHGDPPPPGRVLGGLDRDAAAPMNARAPARAGGCVRRARGRSGEHGDVGGDHLMTHRR